ncbi:hypothetical protein CR513_59553, partial [Mucuna pruriens]
MFSLSSFRTVESFSASQVPYLLDLQFKVSIAPLATLEGCVSIDPQSPIGLPRSFPPTDSTPPIDSALPTDFASPHQPEHGRPLLAKDLKEVQIGPLASYKTKIGMTLGKEEEDYLMLFLSKIKDVFAWSSIDMLGINPNFMCHRLSITIGSMPIAQQKQKLGEEKQRTVREETDKLLAAGFIKVVQYPAWLAKVVMVRKASGK